MDAQAASWSEQPLAAEAIPAQTEQALADPLAPVVEAAPAVGRLAKRAGRGMFVGVVLVAMLVVVVAASLAAGWLLVWLPSELLQLGLAHRPITALPGDMATAVAEVARRARMVL